MVVCFKRICAMILAAVLFLTLNLRASAAETDTKPYIQQILNYYLHYQEAAETDIHALLSQMAAVDWQQAVTWEKLVNNWTWANQEMEVNPDMLPDGLPEDDSLCILVLGYSLNSDGSMQQELEDRLTVALRSAEKYPNAYILCSGGQTSDRKDVTEAQVMAKWLTDRGIDESRVILENTAMSTTENAIYSYEILTREYPQVKSIAIITSDYHVYHSCMMFNAVSLYAGGTMEVVSNAVCAAENESGGSLYQQAWGLAILAGVEIRDLPKPALSQLTEITAEFDGGFSVTAYYDTGLSRDVTDRAVIVEYETEATGRQELAVTYIENGIPATQEVSVGTDIPEMPVEELPYAPVREVLTIAAVWLLAVALLKWSGILK